MMTYLYLAIVFTVIDIILTIADVVYAKNTYRELQKDLLQITTELNKIKEAEDKKDQKDLQEFLCDFFEKTL